MVDRPRRLAEEKYGAKVAEESSTRRLSRSPVRPGRGEIGWLTCRPQRRDSQSPAPGRSPGTQDNSLTSDHRYPSGDGALPIHLNQSNDDLPDGLVLRPGPTRPSCRSCREHEARFEVEECVSAAILIAVVGDAKQVARDLLQKSDMRFRLNNVMGSVQEASEQRDPYNTPKNRRTTRAWPSTLPNRPRFKRLSAGTSLESLRLATHLVAVVEASQGPLSSMSPDDRSAALN